MNRFRLLIIYFTLLATPQIFAYDIKCTIIKGPNLTVNGFSKDLTDLEFTVSKDQISGESIMDLPVVGNSETSFESSNFDSSPQRCSPFFNTYLNDRRFQFTIDFPLDLKKATAIFDHSNLTEHEFNAIIRAKGIYTFAMVDYTVENQNREDASAKLKCEGESLALFIAELQKKCTGIYTAYQKAKTSPQTKPVEIALNQKGSLIGAIPRVTPSYSGQH
jgi:hypothetical protein